MMHPQQLAVVVVVAIAAATLIDATCPACPAPNPNNTYYDSGSIPTATPYTCLGKSRYFTWTEDVQRDSECLLENVRRMNLTDYAPEWSGLGPYLVKGTNIAKFLREFACTSSMYSPLPRVFQSLEMLEIVPTYWLAVINSLERAGFSVWDLVSQACASNCYTPYTSGNIKCDCMNQPGRNVTLKDNDSANEKRLYGCMVDGCTCTGNGKKIGAAHIIFSFYSCMDAYCTSDPQATCN